MYCTQANLVDRFGTKMLLDLTDRAVPKSGVIDAAVVTKAITDAGAEIDGYLAARYALPLAATPDVITDLAQRIAIYKLHVVNVSAKIADDYKLALAALSNISKGVIKLDVAGIEPAASSANGVYVQQGGTRLTHESMKGFG